ILRRICPSVCPGEHQCLRSANAGTHTQSQSVLDQPQCCGDGIGFRSMEKSRKRSAMRPPQPAHDLPAEPPPPPVTDTADASTRLFTMVGLREEGGERYNVTLSKDDNNKGGRMEKCLFSSTRMFELNMDRWNDISVLKTLTVQEITPLTHLLTGFIST
uniref:Uncharacterized protein n=1 Tax=Oncorhynchus tshawytscha TaxID=74940 RepID=A0AAZ3R0I9_ONCTS